MKALQLIPAMEEGGVERYAVSLNHILVRDGWENVVVSRGGRLVKDLIAGGGRHIELDLKSKNPLTAPFRVRALRRLLLAEKPDVVCAHSRVPAWLFHFAAKKMKSKIPWMTFAHGANSISRYSEIMTEGDLVMCPSGFIAEYLGDAYIVDRGKIRVVPHAVDSDRFDPYRLDEEFVINKRLEWGLHDHKVIMSIGRMTPLKGFETLIDAFRLLLADEELKSTKLKLVIVGGAERGKERYAAALRMQVAQYGLSGKVIFAGQQSKTPECLSLADVVVSANTLKPESFGLSMVEALAMGRPVVANAFGGALDIVRDGVNGGLVRLQAGDEPAPAFAKVIKNTLLREFGDLRSEILSRFDMRKMVENTLSVYNEVVNLKKGTAK